LLVAFNEGEVSYFAKADGGTQVLQTLIDQRKMPEGDACNRLTRLFIGPDQNQTCVIALISSSGFEDLACLGNPDPADMKVYCPTGKETFDDDETTEEAPSRGDRCEAA
jgi:hypothetical protein